MGDVLDVLSSIVLFAAALLAAIAALGVVRFRQVLTRMHAVTKASTGAITLAVIGTGLATRTAATLTTLLLVLGLQLFTFPVGANLVARAVSQREARADVPPDAGRA